MSDSSITKENVYKIDSCRAFQDYVSERMIPETFGKFRRSLSCAIGELRKVKTSFNIVLEKAMWLRGAYHFLGNDVPNDKHNVDIELLEEIDRIHHRICRILDAWDERKQCE